MLFDVQFYNRIVDYWKSVYQNIVKVNEYEIDIADCKGIRDLNKIGILLLVEQQGGMNEFFKKLDQQYNTGRLDKRQRSVKCRCRLGHRGYGLSYGNNLFLVKLILNKKTEAQCFRFLCFFCFHATAYACFSAS